jgi:glycosyltransferase involved in cell wall biosynthesis
MKNKILVFAEFFPPLLASDIRIFELTKNIKSKNFVYLVLPPFRFLKKQLSETEMASFDSRRLKKTAVVGGMTGHYINLPSVLKKLWMLSRTIGYVLSMPYLLAKSYSLAKKQNVDAILLKDASVYSGLLGLIVAKLLRKKIILDLDDFIAEYTIELLKLKPNGLRAKVILFIQKLITVHSDSVFCASELLQDYAEIMRNKPAELIPNGVDKSIFHPIKHRKNMTPLCVYCGRFDKWAGINIIEKTAKICVEKGSNVEFLLVGSGDFSEAHLPNLSYKVAVPHNKVPEILAKADIVLVPFPNNKISNGSSPVKLFEAMAMRKPIVASRIRAMTDLLEHGKSAMLCNPDNPLEWHHAIQKLISDKKLAERIANGAYLESKNYSWKLCSQKLDRLILWTV